ncbi:MAG: hypothetical protein BGO63_06795 [Candidatus Accumulibacter sp. 66-26]|nr:hypothetical protein [Accumulibacter sp.]OJW47138.1 MAG: hypothetical protein BGO63_06795 [Candidatus Accumulibacter sp. 66-26]
MRTATEILNAIEARAQRAIVQELRLMKKEVLQLHPSLSPEDQDHADALLLKLGRLESEQIVVATDAGTLEQEFQQVAQAA